MENIKFAIGFAAGRDNVCDVINSYYKDIIEQTKRYKKNVETTIYILIDTTYQTTDIKNFYRLSEEVLNSEIKIRYISEEELEAAKNKIVEKHEIKREEVDMFLGKGHAKARNTILYFALQEENDYLLFWDDDEYPVVNMLNEDGTISWIKQDNILTHLEYIEDADITIGHHCGYISPIPYLDCKTEIHEEELKKYIEAVSNDIITWASIKEKFEKFNGVTYGDPEIVNNKKSYELTDLNGGKWIAGSTLCLNLRNLKEIPAFYNPEGARGEDTFFSTKLKTAKVVKVPLYHFHDGFLKCRQIMKENYPEKLQKVSSKAEKIGERFYRASIGWVKYKPLFVYITDRENYIQKLDEVQVKLRESIDSIGHIFKDINFTVVAEEFEKHYARLEQEYAQYELVNDIWNKIKYKIEE